MPLSDRLLRGQALSDHRRSHEGTWQAPSSCIGCCASLRVSRSYSDATHHGQTL